MFNKILEVRNSKYNGEIKVKWGLGIGKTIEVDDLTQSGKILETVWSSTFRHVSKYLIPNTKYKILVLGVAGGSVFKIIKKHYPNARITGVDIDPTIIELGKKYFSENFENIEVIISDALKIKNFKLKTSFDLIVVDLYSGGQMPEKFQKTPFLKQVKLLKSKKGVVIFNFLRNKNNKETQDIFEHKLNTIFTRVEKHYPIVNTEFICF